MNEIGVKIFDSLISLSLEASRNHFNNKINDYKLKTALIEYCNRQRQKFESISISAEFDIEGFLEYARNKLLGDIEIRIFAIDPRERGKAYKSILAAAISYSNASTEEAKKEVSRLVSNVINIIHEFYKSGFSKQEMLLGAAVVDAIAETTYEHKSEILASSQAAKEELKNDMGQYSGEIIAAIKQANVYSLEAFVNDAETGNWQSAENKIKTILDILSQKHDLFPDYGISIKNGSFISCPRTTDAEKLYPPTLSVRGKIRYGNTYVRDTSIDVFDYAYRHQLKLVMEVEDAKKYLGDQLDPIQTEAERIIGQELQVTPPPFPPAFPCSIIVGKTVVFDYVLMRTNEILDDGTIVINNREQEKSPFFLEFKVCGKQGDDSSFKINSKYHSNKGTLKNLRFIKALQTEKNIRIHVLSEDADIFAGNVNHVNYETGFPSIDEEIDFMERICTIEDYYHVTLNIADVITYGDLKTVHYLSDLVTKEFVSLTWSKTKLNGIVTQTFREKIVTLDDNPFALSLIGIATFELWNTPIEIPIMKTYKKAVFQNIDKIKALVSLLDDGDTINIILIPGDDETSIDTLRIPEELIHSLSD